MIKQPPDGDCFFHSIAFEIARIKGKPMKENAGTLLRRELCRNIRDDHAWKIDGKSVQEWVVTCAGTSLSVYLGKMFVNAGRGSYGGFLEAALLANRMGVRIHMSDALNVGCSLRSHLSSPSTWKVRLQDF